MLMRAILRTGVLLVPCLLAIAGCATAADPPSPDKAPLRQLNQGYSLLYKLMSDESDVHKLLIFKHADEPLAGLIQQIATFSNDTKGQLEKFAKAAPPVELGVPDLPPVEQKSRDLESKEETSTLLGSSGKDFELRLIFTQAEAMNYGAQLAKALADQEVNPARKTFLGDVATRCAGFHDKVMGLLTVKS